MLSPEMTPEVRAAMDNVRQFHPEITQVFYGTDNRWFFCGEGFDSPAFADGTVDVGLLKDAADSVPYLPIAYAID